MMALPTARKAHNYLSLATLIILLWLALTGGLHVVQHDWMGIDDGFNFMKLHTLSILGFYVGAAFPLVAGALVIAQIITGLKANGTRIPCYDTMSTWRKLHSAVAISVAPLYLILAVTGFAYRFFRRVIVLDKDKVEFLMSWHSFAEFNLSSVYPLILLLLTALLVVTGWQMMWGFEYESGANKKYKKWLGFPESRITTANNASE